MKISRVGASIAAATALVLGLSACSSNNPSASSSSSASGTQLQGSLSGAGSTAQEAAVTAWTKGFSSVQPNVQVQYNPVGSGSGRTSFLAGQTAFAGSDASMTADEYTKSKAICGPNGAINIPVYISPIAIAYNLPSVKTPIKLDADTIAKIFSGKITTWNDPAIASQNAGVTLPSTKITPVHRSDESGTTENFTDYLSQAAPSSWPDKKAQKWPAAYKGESAQGTSGVVSLVKSTEGAVVYADSSAVQDLQSASVKVGNDYVAHTAEAAAKVVQVSQRVGGGAPGDMAIKLDRKTTEAGAYPIVLVSYQIYCTEYKDQNTGNMVKAFGKYVVSQDGQKTAAAAAGNAPLSQALTDEATKAIDAIKVG